MSTNLSPVGGAAAQFLDNNGNPLTGGKLYTYEAGTTTPQATYTTSAGNVAHANPIILDAAGRVPGGEIWLTASLDYKFSLFTSADVLIATWDNIATSVFTNASNVVYDPAGSGAVQRTVESKLRDVVSVLDFLPDAERAAVIAGSSTYDISDSIRYAIDSLGPNGGVVEFPNGGAGVVGSTVYIPPKGYGVILQGNKFAITGGGVGTHAIFETGMPGNSYGGSTNWNEPDETVLNQGLVIRDFVFLECGTAIKVFNAIWRSEFSGNWAYQNVTTLIHAKRCFYSKTIFNHAIIGRAGRGANDPCYWFEEAVNVQTIVGNSASGIYGGSNKSGTGYLFTGGMAGLSFSNNSAEACITGLKITGEITGAEIVGCYFELDTVGIDLGSAGKTVDIGGCFFFSNVITAITCSGGWVAGTLRADNSIDPVCLVDLSTSTNALTIERPLSVLPLTLAYSAYEIVPSTWSLSGSIVVRRPASTYDALSGQNAQRGLLTEQTNGLGLVALPYAGDLGAASGDVPVFCFSAITPSTVTVDTKIVYRPNLCVQFTAIIQDFTLTYKVAGAVRWGTTVFRLDSEVVTVTASNSAGFLRLVFGNLGASISISDIRIWIG
jgi:hypothetical protein